MSVFHNSALLGSSGSSGYKIERSLRFNSADSAYLNWTPASAGSQTTWSWSGWIKRSALSATTYRLFGTGDNNSAANQTSINLSSDSLDFYNVNGGSKTTTAKFRDPSAWYHVIVVWDSNNATASDRIRLYVNGTRLTAFSSSTDPSSGTNTVVNSAVSHTIGTLPTNSGNYFSGYLSEIHFIDGQALTPSSFGETNPVTGVWQPKRYTGTYGTNGFYLKFADNSGTTSTTLGKDSSGNGNNWTPNNFSITAGAGNDSLIDTPTPYADGGNGRGNYCTLNPLDGSPSGLSNGNLDAASANAYPTIIPGSGQWYYEVTGTGYQWNGQKSSWTPRAGSHNFGQRPFASFNPPSGFLALNTQNLPEPTIKKPSSYMDVVLDTGANILAAAQSKLTNGADLIWIKDRANPDNHQLIDTVRGGTLTLGSNTAGPDTTYSAPSGSSVAWCWDKSATPGFDIVTYTGTGSATTVAHSLGVAPSMMIVKRRDAIDRWGVYHTSLGNTQYLYLDSTQVANTASAVWNNTSPSSSVFSVGTSAVVNANTGTYVAYLWSEVAGFSKFGSYTGNSSSDGPFVFCNFRPRWVMVKRTDVVGDWYVIDAARNSYNGAGKWLLPNFSAAEYDNDASYPIDILSNGFKIRTSIPSLNTGTFIYAVFAESPQKYSLAR